MSTEYGAQLPKSGVVYMRGPLEVVTAWIAEFGTVTPLQLVARESADGTTGHWHD
jgi:hypothetical protein